jgi:hypothetical protein
MIASRIAETNISRFRTDHSPPSCDSRVGSRFASRGGLPKGSYLHALRYSHIVTCALDLLNIECNLFRFIRCIG